MERLLREPVGGAKQYATGQFRPATQYRPAAGRAVGAVTGNAQPGASHSPALKTGPATHPYRCRRRHGIGIARKYGVKLSALEEANPDMNPARIRVGQVLNLPPP